MTIVFKNQKRNDNNCSRPFTNFPTLAFSCFQEYEQQYYSEGYIRHPQQLPSLNAFLRVFL
jgi:hypothetical protein